MNLCEMSLEKKDRPDWPVRKHRRTAHVFRSLLGMADQLVAFIDSVDALDHQCGAGFFTGFQNYQRSEQFLGQSVAAPLGNSSVKGYIADDVKHIARNGSLAAAEIDVDHITCGNDLCTGLAVKDVPFQVSRRHFKSHYAPDFISKGIQVRAWSDLLV